MMMMMRRRRKRRWMSKHVSTMVATAGVSLFAKFVRMLSRVLVFNPANQSDLCLTEDGEPDWLSVILSKAERCGTTHRETKGLRIDPKEKQPSSPPTLHTPCPAPAVAPPLGAMGSGTKMCLIQAC